MRNVILKETDACRLYTEKSFTEYYVTAIAAVLYT